MLRHVYVAIKKSADTRNFQQISENNMQQFQAHFDKFSSSLKRVYKLSNSCALQNRKNLIKFNCSLPYHANSLHLQLHIYFKLLNDEQKFQQFINSKSRCSNICDCCVNTVAAACCLLSSLLAHFFQIAGEISCSQVYTFSSLLCAALLPEAF